MRAKEELKTFSAMKTMFNVKNLSLSVERQLYERLVIRTVMYPAKTWIFRMEKIRKLEIIESKCVRRNQD